MKKRLFLALFLVSCAQGGGSDGGGSTLKSIFASWIDVSHSFSFDLSGKTFGSNPMTLVLATGNQCAMTVNITGSQTAGTYSLSGSTYVPATGTGTDPGCANFNESGNYSRSGSYLRFCATTPTTNCTNYE